jgi:Mg2+-importing ATPase
MNLNTNTFWQYSIEQWFEELNTSKSGLDTKFSRIRLRGSQDFQIDQVDFKHKLKLFLTTIFSIKNLLFLGIIFASLYTTRYQDLIIIVVVILLSSGLSFIQELKVKYEIQKYNKLNTPRATVIREGIEKEVLKSHLMKGDIIKLSAGDLIPADALIIDSNSLFTDESNFEGKTEPRHKYAATLKADTIFSKRVNSLWAGTSVIHGFCTAIVINIGKNALFSTNSNLVKVTPTILDKSFNHLGFFLVKIAFVFSLIFLILSLLYDRDPFSSVLFVFFLTGAIAPDMIPAINALSLSVGASRIHKMHGLVKNLSEFQILGEIEVLCTDKTGTLTEGEVKIDSIVNFDEKEDSFTKSLLIINSFFENGYQNSIDKVLKKYADDFFAGKKNVRKIAEIPFDFNRKRMSVAVKLSENILNSVSEEQITLITKGSFENTLKICSKIRLESGEIAFIDKYLERLTKLYEKYSASGQKVLVVCYRQLASGNINLFEVIQSSKLDTSSETEMIFSGFLIYSDPIKSGVSKILEEISKLSIKHKVITGDSKLNCKIFAKELGYYNPIIMKGSECEDLTLESLQNRVKEVDFFAEVEPHQKEIIVNALKFSYKVGYLGNGLNDVAAMKAADVAISVKNSQEVVREAADLVLLTNDISLVPKAISESRKSFTNSIKYIFIRIGSNFGTILSVAIGIFLFPFSPMIPVQLFLMNLLSNIPYLAMTADNEFSDEILKQDKWDIGLIQNYMFTFGIFSAVFNLISFWILFNFLGFSEAEFHTSWFIITTLSELIIIYILRTKSSVFGSLPNIQIVVWGVITTIATLIIPYTTISKFFAFSSLSLTTICSLLVILLIYILMVEKLKEWFYRTSTNE